MSSVNELHSLMMNFVSLAATFTATNEEAVRIADPTPVTNADLLSNTPTAVEVLLELGFTLSSGEGRQPIDGQITRALTIFLRTTSRILWDSDARSEQGQISSSKVDYKRATCPQEDLPGGGSSGSSLPRWPIGPMPRRPVIPIDGREAGSPEGPEVAKSKQAAIRQQIGALQREFEMLKTTAG